MIPQPRLAHIGQRREHAVIPRHLTRTSRVTRPHAVQKLLIHAEVLSRSTTLPHLLHLYFTSKTLLYAVWNTPN